MSENTKSILGFRLKALEAELLAKEPTLMQDYLDTSVALAAVERSGVRYEVQVGEFVGYRAPIEAIEAYLDKVKEFTDEEVVITALMDGGFAPRDKRRRYNIKDSIRYHLKSNRLVVVDGKLGKAEWPPGGLPEAIK